LNISIGAAMSKQDNLVTAAVILIGDEVLSGRTQDKNLEFIAGFLGEIDIQVEEARIVPDKQSRIVEAVNALRPQYDYIFTTGGIGPTHDDITADAIAAAFNVGIDYNDEAIAILRERYAEKDFNDARMRMTRIPHGASLIENPVSKAPGFQIENVFVMAGVPKIMQAMMGCLAPRLHGGAKMISRTIRCNIGEGWIAASLETLQSQFPTVSLASYPFFEKDGMGTNLVARSTDEAALNQAEAALIELVASASSH